MGTRFTGISLRLRRVQWLVGRWCSGKLRVGGKRCVRPTPAPRCNIMWKCIFCSPVENHGKFLQDVDIILRARIIMAVSTTSTRLSRRSKGVIRGGSWKSQSHNKPEPLTGDEDITSNNQRCAWPGTCLLDITLEWCWHTGLIPWTQTTATLNIFHPHTAAPSETSETDTFWNRWEEVR